ncbi:MAG TPA: 4Fe-4S binding protein [Myxococcales bacterium]
MAAIAPERRRKLAALARLTRKLVEPQPIPIDDALLDCFDWVVSDPELDALLSMGIEPRRVADLGLAPDLLASLVRKDLVVLRPAEAAADGETVHAAAFLPGWFESQLCDGGETEHHREFARRVERLFESWREQNNLFARFFVNALYRLRNRPFQTIAAGPGAFRRVEVGRAIQAPPAQVRPTASVVELVERHGATGSIGLIHCFCRQTRKLVGAPCRFDLPRETCLQVGETARLAIAHGLARPISKDEALALLAAAQKGGAIHTVFHDRDDAQREEIAICSCCWDCCGVLGTWNRGAGAAYFRCFERATLAAPEKCTACGTCRNFCPTDALSVVQARISVDERRCLGCGQCAFQCPAGALSLVSQEREVFLGMQPKAKARLGS